MGPGRSLEPRQVVKRSLIGRPSGTCEKHGPKGGGDEGTGVGPDLVPLTDGQGKRYTPLPHVCGAEKSLELTALRVSGRCADMRLTQTRNGFSPILSRHMYHLLYPVRYN